MRSLPRSEVRDGLVELGSLLDATESDSELARGDLQQLEGGLDLLLGRDHLENADTLSAAGDREHRADPAEISRDRHPGCSERVEGLSPSRRSPSSRLGLLAGSKDDPKSAERIRPGQGHDRIRGKDRSDPGSGGSDRCVGIRRRTELVGQLRQWAAWTDGFNDGPAHNRSPVPVAPQGESRFPARILRRLVPLPVAPTANSVGEA